MEVATDEQVLTLLDCGEQKEYGKALLCAIENFGFSKIAPRLIGIVDDKKNIERRIKMIKMIDFFRYRRKTVLVTGVLCVAVLSGILLTSGLTKSNSATTQKESTVQSNKYNINTLLKFKTAYVGNNSNVVNLIDSLPFANLRKEVSLKTDSKPYGISANYDFSASSLSTEAIEATFKKNATVIFALIDNVDEINFNFGSFGEKPKHQYTRIQLQKNYGKDLREYAKDVNTFETLLNNFSLSLIAYPQKYTLAMSNTPGIRILAQYEDVADKVEYSTTSGKLLTWNSISGKVNECGQNVKLPLATAVYWSPLVNVAVKEVNEIAVKATILNKNVRLVQKQVNIKFDGSTYFYSVVPSDDVIIAATVKSQSQNLKTIDEAVSLAIKAQSKGYGAGEVSTEGHVILDTEENDGKIKVYTIASFGAFGFENSIFTTISGSGAISTVMTFSKNAEGEYSLLEYKEPMDGTSNLESKKDMFPQRLWDKVLSEQKYYPELVKQEEEQAKQYLQSIGRNAKVSDTHVEKKLAEINVEASNKLFAGLTKSDPELNNFPYWIGTKELLENGVRYIYETSQSKGSDSYDLISFKKTQENGAVVKKYQYKIIGNEIYLLSQRN